MTVGGRRCVMKRWYWLLGLLPLVGVAAPLLYLVLHKSPPSETNDILVVGQTYVFTGDPTFIAEVLEPPRGEWVKVHLLNNKKPHIPARETWIHLPPVKAVSLVDPKDVKDE
jgi:hypothetical protein